MSYRAWDLFTSYDYVRSRLEDEYADDALEDEEKEFERRERDRHAGGDERLPLREKAGRA